ncbi:queuosine precursor transporter [Brevibacillus choshinensis]|uniref:queuosine precursor transporter n=1 Tax=Brevibacillus choshinensis TaxID=54911 RepID=UPI002E1E0D2E|nr:queuosine precursor transporter [Brevibacillus choshinensis]MED4584769.1 queuosine precursor transporter [Brevibacillus choshinensis]MED4753423.1 queuosine precursor transporter [Brevibacillus choshinensis]MED4782148.1 queuosine precursor transporter [Brevibacillus choshinensis]
MFNVSLGVGFALVNFGLFLLCYRLFGRMGLYAWLGMATVLANIQVVKTIEMFGLVMTLGNTIYASIYLTSDLLNEKYGEKAAKKAVWFGFFTLIATTIIMQLVLLFEPQESDISQGALETLFGLMPRLALGSLCAYLLSQFVDVKIYSWLKKKCPGPNQLWIRNNGSTLFSQMLDSITFCSIAFLGVYPMDVWWEILLTTYLIKFIVSAASTPVLYIARNMRVPEE